jgi:hypothetical protein
MHWGPIVCHFVFFVGKRKGQNTNKAYSLHFLKLEWEQASHVGRFAISLLAKAKWWVCFLLFWITRAHMAVCHGALRPHQ